MQSRGATYTRARLAQPDGLEIGGALLQLPGGARECDRNISQCQLWPGQFDPPTPIPLHPPEPTAALQHPRSIFGLTGQCAAPQDDWPNSFP
eukprot:5954318-Pyramimonas_sp.AAC.1